MPAVYTFEVTRTITCRVSAVSVEEAAEKTKPQIAGTSGPGTPEVAVTELAIKRIS